jgi:hypothetical protein
MRPERRVNDELNAAEIAARCDGAPSSVRAAGHRRARRAAFEG